MTNLHIGRIAARRATWLTVAWLASQSVGVGARHAGQDGGAAPDPPVTCSVTFLGDHPAEGDMGWTDANQGVAHDAGHWFFTNETQIVKIPVGVDVAAEIDPDDSEDWPAGVSVRSIPTELWFAGWQHFGDLDQANGFLFVPVNRFQGGPYPVAAIAVFRTSDLSYVGVAAFDGQDRPSFAAINPTDGFLYMSSWVIDKDHALSRYHLDFDQDRPPRRPGRDRPRRKGSCCTSRTGQTSSIRSSTPRERPSLPGAISSSSTAWRGKPRAR